MDRSLWRDPNFIGHPTWLGVTEWKGTDSLSTGVRPLEAKVTVSVNAAYDLPSGPTTETMRRIMSTFPPAEAKCSGLAPFSSLKLSCSGLFRLRWSIAVAFPLKANWQRNRLWFSSTNCHCTGLFSLNICTSLHPQPSKTHTVYKRSNTHLKHICWIHVCFLLIYHAFVEAIPPHKLFSKLHLVSLVGIFCKEKSVVDINNILRMALIVFA